MNCNGLFDKQAKTVAVGSAIGEVEKPKKERAIDGKSEKKV